MRWAASAACCVLLGCYASSGPDSGDAPQAQQYVGAASDQPSFENSVGTAGESAATPGEGSLLELFPPVDPVLPCENEFSGIYVFPDGCFGGPDLYMSAVTVCVGCSAYVQLTVGNAGDEPVDEPFEIQVNGRSFLIHERLEPGALSAIYELGEFGDHTFTVVAPGADCDALNNVIEHEVPFITCL